ncbi:hypothetical protein DY000_02054316 [Brassica cretica]|uniref:Tim10-like domain-containing protein n=1 Tax=Brassica cretica TaxID=69181 RepID=A0ABQ7AJ52_BRACR|nr:hypothetical protein DY000_02054316 [Brassica cretica]
MASSMGCLTDSLPQLNTSFLLLFNSSPSYRSESGCSIYCFIFRFRSNPTSFMVSQIRMRIKISTCQDQIAKVIFLGKTLAATSHSLGSHNNVTESRCYKNCLTDCARAVLAGGATAKSEALMEEVLATGLLEDNPLAELILTNKLHYP